MSDMISKIWKSDEGKKRSFKNLKISMGKIENEFDLLQNLGGTITNQQGEDPTLNRALRDSFLIHFRRVHFFLYAKDQEDRNITAADFFETADIWKSKRIKEGKNIKEFEELASKVTTSYSIGDDDLVLGRDKKDFKEAVEELGKTFKQFVELNLPVEKPAEEMPETEGKSEAPMEKDLDLTEKTYGTDEDLYKTYTNQEGTLTVEVLHTNQSVRKLIQNHIDEPKYFLDNLKQYKDHQQKARKWLAEVVMDNKTFFKENKVLFVMA